MKKQGNKAKKRSLEEELLYRLNVVQGQLQSSKRLAKEDTKLLVLELHSITRALDNIKKYVILNDAGNIKKRFQDLDDVKGVRLANDLIAKIEQQHVKV